MKGVKFKLIDMLSINTVELKANCLPRVGESLWLGKDQGVVKYVDHVFQRDIRGGYSFKEYVVIVEWR